MKKLCLFTPHQKGLSNSLLWKFDNRKDLHRIGFSIFVLLWSLSTFLAAQAPSGFNYQAVIRDLSGNVLANHQMGIQFSILAGSTTGTNVYSESHVITTNGNGLVSLTIGGGTVISGKLDDIAWEQGHFYLAVAVDLSNNGKFSALGVSPLLSVPFALYAQKAGNTGSGSGIPISNPQKGDLVYYNGSQWQSLGIANNGDILSIEAGIPKWKQGTHYVGEFYGGGIIFFVWEKSGVQHGLIASLIDLPSTAIDEDGDGVPDGYNLAPNIGTVDIPAFDQIPNANSHWNGVKNTDNIVTFQNAKSLSGYAAQACRSYNAGGYSDWYLPSVHELSLLYRSLFILNQTLEEDSNASTKIVTGNYWASTLFNTTQGWNWAMARGYSSNLAFHQFRFIRPIRQF